MNGLALVIFVLLEVAGLLIAITWLLDKPTVIPRQNPRYIFRLVKRDERAVYVRIMRRTTAVAMRDIGRAAAHISRQIGRALLPAVERAAMALRAILGDAK